MAQVKKRDEEPISGLIVCPSASTCLAMPLKVTVREFGMRDSPSRFLHPSVVILVCLVLFTVLL